ncbi:hypothetical protein MUK42_36588, partial [Musa troglodytarum]
RHSDGEPHGCGRWAAIANGAKSNGSSALLFRAPLMDFFFPLLPRVLAMRTADSAESCRARAWAISHAHGPPPHCSSCPSH